MEQLILPNHIKSDYLIKIKTTHILKYISSSNKNTHALSFSTYSEYNAYYGFILRDQDASILIFTHPTIMAEWNLTYDNFSDIILDQGNINFYISPEVFSKNDKIYGVHIIRKVYNQKHILSRLPKK